MQLRETEQTLVTLANASDLVKSIAFEVIGNEVADTFNGTPINRAMLHNLAQAKFQGAVAKYLEGV